MILLWGVPGDGPLRAVRHALRERKEPFFLLDQHAFADTALHLSVGGAVQGTLRSGSAEIALEAITSVYVRPYDVRQLPGLEGLGPDAPLWRHAVELDDALQAWTEVTPALVINRPSAMASNGSKPYQAALIRASGFDVPDTLVTTDPAAALAFRERHGSVIYKSVSGVRSIVSRFGDGHLARLDDIANCPTQFQEYVAGTDWRVHVVGEEVFAAEILCDRDDYRYSGRAGGVTDIRAGTLGPDLAARCRGLASALGLRVAGIDLRRSDAGRWVCFEVNPSPGFTFYQEETGQNIGGCIARMLAAGGTSVPSSRREAGPTMRPRVPSGAQSLSPITPSPLNSVVNPA
jgi:glutathione synthase/RimK-type ligase-like ATP-grasp enzyme